MNRLKIGLICAAVVSIAACDRSTSTVSAPTDQGNTVSVQVTAGTAKVDVSNSIAPALAVGDGNSSVRLEDVQQTQSGAGQTENVTSDNQTPIANESVSAGDGRGVTIKIGQVVLQRDGVGTITVPAGR